MGHVLLALASVHLCAAMLSAQSIELDVASSEPAATLLSEIVAGGDYLVIDRDTTLTTDSHVPGDVVIFRSRVSLEGAIAGSVAVVASDFFIRPGATVGGSIAAIGGGVYPSGLAQVGGIVQLDPRTELAIDTDAGTSTITIRAPDTHRLLRLPSLFGFALPTYDRVDGLSVFWSAAVASAGVRPAASLVGTVAYRTERRRFGGSLRVDLRPSENSVLTARVSRSTRVIGTWIRGDLENSLSSLVVHSDLRDYYESDQLSLTVGRAIPPTLIEGERFIAPRLELHVSNDRSIETGTPWSLFQREESWRHNPAVDDGVLAAVELGADAGWRGATATFAGTATAEWAPGSAGDFEFAQARADGVWSMTALYGHQVQVSGHLVLPLGAHEAPLQRWGFVGGPGTLPTLATAALRGDHVLFVESSYAIPLRPIRIPTLGPPTLLLEHAAGTAWRTGDPRPPLEQNAGVGLRLGIVDVTLHVDPTESPLDPTLSFGIRLPLP
ncbi:MAG: hypothetical protein WD737_09020 [Gemmatimonadota bacterium]